MTRIKKLARALVQKLLHRRGLALLRHGGHLPPTWGESLRRLRTEGVDEMDGRSPAVCCLDSGIQIQTDLLSVFGAVQVTFVCDLAAWRQERPAAGWQILVVDAESFELAEILRDEQTRRDVKNILVRASLGHFWSGGGDLGDMTRAFRAAGFGLRDTLLGQISLLSWSAPLEPTAFVYENERFFPDAGAAPQPAVTNALTLEALAMLSPPLVQAAQLRRLAGRGSFGCAAGVLNPGAVRWKGRTILLARGERLPWAVQKLDEVSFATSACPVLMELNPAGDAAIRAEELRVEGGEEIGRHGARVEDFRLFEFQGEIFSNCAHISVIGRDPDKGRPPALEKLTTRVVLARCEPASPRLTFLGAPQLDRPTGRVEKNWAMFEAGGELHLLYSFNPYRLLRATRWPALEFTTIQECDLRLPADVLPAALRNSINPVEYDERYFLHVVHAVFPVKRYAFWAVLIDKSTLLPTRVSARPLVCGWRSAPASIIYITAVVCGADEVEIYGGLNDASVGRWTLRRACLDASWLPLA